MAITGGCLCGAVRYSVDVEAPIAARACWCRLCQSLAAGNATLNVVFPTEALTITGPMTDYVSVADSGNVMHRRFCPTCGTAITSEAEVRPHLTIIRAGTLDDPSFGKPEMTVWTEAAPDWAIIDPDIPSLPRQPPPVGS